MVQGAHRGDQPRHQQNRLLFLAADYDSVGRLKDQVRSLPPWQSIVTDYRETNNMRTILSR